jgi:hypothetical protein
LKLTVLAMWAVFSVLGLGVAVVSASAAEFEFKKAFGPDGGSLSEFSKVCSTAADTEEDIVYVLDCGANALYKFDFEGNPVDFGGSSPDVSGNELSGLTIGTLEGQQQIAVNSTSHVIYVTDGEALFGGTSIQAFDSSGEPVLFTQGPTPATNEIGGFSAVHGVAVDSSGNIYISGTADEIGGNRDLSIYTSSGALLVEGILEFPVIAPGNIAVDSNGSLYLLRGDVFRYTPSEYPVTPDTIYEEDPETFNPNSTRSIAVNPLTDEVYALETTPARVAVFDPEGNLQVIFGGPGEEGELLDPEGIAVGIDAPDFARAFVGQHPAGGPSQVKIFREKEVVKKPTIDSTTVESVTSSSAKLRAKINPNNSETIYWFEYGLEDCAVSGSNCTQVPIAGVSIGDGRKPVTVTQLVTGLEADTIYHFRVVAENEEGRIDGLDKTFKTQPSTLAFSLSDARAWEMVSPPNKFGGTLLRSQDMASQASGSGNKLVYASRGSIVEEPAGNRLLESSSVLAKRGAGGVWSSEDLTAPHSESTQIRTTTGTEFKLFSPELLEAVMEPRDKTPLSPEASEQTPYRWSDGSPPQFRPLVNPFNVPAGTAFGPVAGEPRIVLSIEGASPDLHHIVIRSVPPLVEDAHEKAIYMWSDGDLAPVSELPDGEAVEEGEVVNGILGSGEGSVRHAVSDDGSRVFWAPVIPGHTYDAAGNRPVALYLRNTVTGESTRLDVAQDGATGGTEPLPAFNAASADGDVAFFTDSQRLTEDASPAGRDLYRCEIGQVEGQLGCAELTDVSAPLEESGESAQVRDQVSALSKDGTRLYFVARGVLDEAANEEGETAASGEPNLYLWQEGEGVRFIATLGDQDDLVWGGTSGYSAYISADVSPSGRYFAFTSERSLTGYDNVNSSDQANTEVFLYDAELGDGRLSCVSCNPSGAAAVGERLAKEAGFLPQDPNGRWGKRWVAATLPEATTSAPGLESEGAGHSFYRPRSVLDNGRVFFNAADPLVPADSNGNWDVYQYEPIDAGSCKAAVNSASVSRSGGGCVGLLSSGTAEGDSGILDSSASGNDVFFLTRGKLSVLDRDNEFDVYDARVNGIPAVLEPVKECAGEACQPSVGPPNRPTPASESFKGAQSPVKCRKGQRKVRRHGKTVCVRKKHKKQNKHHKQRAGKNGRAGR